MFHPNVWTIFQFAGWLPHFDIVFRTTLLHLEVLLQGCLPVCTLWVVCCVCVCVSLCVKCCLRFTLLEVIWAPEAKFCTEILPSGDIDFQHWLFCHGTPSVLPKILGRVESVLSQNVNSPVAEALQRKSSNHKNLSFQLTCSPVVISLWNGWDHVPELWTQFEGSCCSFAHLWPRRTDKFSGLDFERDFFLCLSQFSFLFSPSCRYRIHLQKPERLCDIAERWNKQVNCVNR